MIRYIVVLSILLFSFNLPELQADETSLLPNQYQLVSMEGSVVAVDMIELSEEETALNPHPVLFQKSDEKESFFKILVKQKNKEVSALWRPISYSSFLVPAAFEWVNPFRSSGKTDDFLGNLQDHLEDHFGYGIGIYGVYDDNIFLTPRDKTSDYIMALRQTLYLEYPMDPFYWEASYGVNLNFYGQADETTDFQQVYTRLSYFPIDKISFGVSNYFQKIGDSDIGSATGDQVIRTGYIFNTARTEFEYELSERVFLKSSWNYDMFDFDFNSFFINRDEHSIDFQIKEYGYWNKSIDTYLGYRF